LTYSKIVALHSRIVWAEYDMRRSYVLYEIALKEAIDLENSLKAAYNSDRIVERRSWQAKRKGQLAHYINLFEWIWTVYVESYALRFLSIICVLLSLSVVYSEVTFSLDFYGVTVSLYAILIDQIEILDFFTITLLILIPVTFIATCAYWGLFKLRLFNYFKMITHHCTDANSILFSAAYLCRLSLPLAYNFFLMIHLDGAVAYHDVMGDIELTPLLGESWNIYFPMTLIVFALISTFNLYTRFIQTFCIKKFQRFVFDNDFTDSKIEEGKQILAFENELREKGTKKEEILDPGLVPLEEETVKTNAKSKPPTPRTTLPASVSSAPSRLYSFLKGSKKGKEEEDVASLLEKGEAEKIGSGRKKRGEK